jgi:hypothetical protein
MGACGCDGTRLLLADLPSAATDPEGREAALARTHNGTHILVDFWAKQAHPSESQSFSGAVL